MITGRNSKMHVIFLLSAALLLASGCGRETPVALNDPVKVISKAESNTEVLRSWVLADRKADVLVHIDSSDDMRVFPVSYRETMKNAGDHLKLKNVEVIDQVGSLIENGGTVNLGYMAGLFKRVIWVLPARASVGEGSASSFRKILEEKRPYSKADLADLKNDGKFISGSIDGIPLTVTNLEDLEIGPDETAILDVDLGFFIGQKTQDPEGRMGTRVVLDFLRVLRRKNIHTAQASINLGSLGGAVSYDMRYFGDILTEIMMDPSILEGALPQKYEMMLEAEDALIAGKYDRAVALYDHLTERSPREAGLHYSKAVAQGFMGDGEGATKSLFAAYDRDAVYLRGFFQLARVLAVNGKIEAGEKILDSEALAKLINEEELEFQKGMFFFNAGDFYSSLTHLESIANKRPKDFPLRTVMYQAYKGLQNDTMMLMTLERLLKIDEKRVIRDMPWVYKEIGRLSEAAGIVTRARDAYSTYLEYVPDDQDAEELRAKIGMWKELGVEAKSVSLP